MNNIYQYTNTFFSKNNLLIHLTILILLTPLIYVENLYVNLVGKTVIIGLGLLSLVAICMQLTIRQLIQSNAIKFLASLFLCMVFLKILQYIAAPNVAALKSIAQHFYILLIVLAFISAGKDSPSIQQLNYILLLLPILFLVILCYLLAQFISSGHVLLIQSFAGWFENPNTFGLYVFFSLPLFLWIYKDAPNVIKMMICLICLLFIVLSRSRTALVAYCCFIFFLSIYPILIRKKILFYVPILLLLVLGVMVIVLSHDGFLHQLNHFSFVITRKSMLSGRDDLWQHAMTLIVQKPWFGWGGGASMMNLLNTTHDPHNQYLSILIQHGIVGMVLYLLLLLSVVYALYQVRTHYLTRLVYGFLIGILFIASFEEILFQGILFICLSFWALLGTSLSRVSH